jgi:hypothetical protein
MIIVRTIPQALVPVTATLAGSGRKKVTRLILRMYHVKNAKKLNTAANMTQVDLRAA